LGISHLSFSITDWVSMKITRGDRVYLAAYANDFKPPTRDIILTDHHAELDAKAKLMEEQLKIASIAAEKSDKERRYQENLTFNNMRNVQHVTYPANPFGTTNNTKGFVNYNTNKESSRYYIKANDLFGAAHVDRVNSHDFASGSVGSVEPLGDNVEDINSESADNSNIDTDAGTDADADTTINEHVVPMAQYVSLSISAPTAETAVSEDSADFMSGWIKAVTTFQTVSEEAKMDLFAQFIKLVNEADEYQLGKVTVDLWHHKLNEVFTNCFDLKMDHTFMHRDGVPFGRVQWEDSNFTTEDEKKTLSNYKKKIRTECVHQVDYIRDTMNSVIRGYSVKGNKTFTTVFYQHRDIKQTLNILLETYADNSGDKKTALDDLVSVLDKSLPLTSTNYAGYSAELREVSVCSLLRSFLFPAAKRLDFPLMRARTQESRPK